MSEVFEKLKSHMQASLTKEPNPIEFQGLKGKSLGLELDGSQSLAVSLFVSQAGPIELREGLNGPMDCVIRCSSDTFHELTSGSLNVAWALMTRKLKIEGSLDLAKDFGLALKKIWRT